MSKLFLAFCTLFALAPSFQQVRNVASIVEPTPLTEVSFNNGNFSSTNGFTVTKSGTGFTANNTYPNAFNISDTTSYLEIKPTSTTAISGEDGFSIALNLSHKAGATTDAYEQLFTVEGEGGESAHINIATLYYLASSTASATYSVPNGGNKIKDYYSKKSQIFVVDYANESIFCYVNGTLINKFTPDNSKAAVIADVIDTFKLLQDKGHSLYLRKPCVKKTGKNTSSLIAGNIAIYNSVISAEQAAKMFEVASKAERNDLPISVNSCDDYKISSSGYGINHYDSERANSFRIEDTTSYLTIKAGENKRLTQNNGFSLSFYHQSTTDTFYSGNTSLRPNVTDDFEQLLTVEDNSGRSAHICLGGMYYSEDQESYQYAFCRPQENGHLLLHTNWKYVTINVDGNNQSTVIYADGEEIQRYDGTHPTRAAMVKTVASMFADTASSLGGEIHLRKPFSLKVGRNSATNVFDEMILDEPMSVNAIKALHDSKLGRIRISFVPNVDVTFVDVVGEGSVALPTYEGEVEGYVFDGYYFDEEHTQRVPDGYVATESMTLYPYFTLVKYNITYHLNGGVNNENNPTQYTRNDKITFLDASKEGYEFLGWYRTEKFENRVKMLVEGSYGNIDLYAKFERTTYTVTYVLNGGLLTGDAIETFSAIDGVINLPGAWKPGYAFIGWYSDENFTQKIETIDPKCAQNVIVYANFAKIYKINYILNGGALPTGSIDSFTVYDGIINLPNAYQSGFTFEGWYNDEELTNKVLSLDTSIAQDVTLYAKFVEEKEEPEPEPETKKGCGGSVVAISSLSISLMALVGALIIRKRKVK